MTCNKKFNTNAIDGKICYILSSVCYISKEYLFEAVEFAAFGIDIVLVHLEISCKLLYDYSDKLPPHRQI